MKPSSDNLYELLPVVYRQRDAEQGEPLRALLGVIAEQVNLVESDIAQMYDNWFVETCEEWVVPYIADLIGYKLLRDSGEPTTTVSSEAREQILSHRRDVANVIGYRRRKGALALLELLARDAANYPAARVVEFYKRLARTQSINFQQLKRGRTVDLRDGDALDLLESPFDNSARTLDVRSAGSNRARGYYNIPAIGAFIWRLKSYSVTKTPAYCLEEEAPECYTFSVLGHDTRLYNKPNPETEPTQIAGELNLPTPIRRRAFEKRVFEDRKFDHTEASEKYYDRSLSIFLLDRDGKLNQIPRDKIIPANLSDWRKYRPKRNFVAVDPKLGRIVFPSNQKPRYGVSVSYHYAFGADIGGGEYNRPLSHPQGAEIFRVGREEKLKTINEGLAAWELEKKEAAAQLAAAEQNEKEHSKSDNIDLEAARRKNKRLRAAVIEIRDSGVYTEQLKIELKADESLQIRAANMFRPIIRLLDYQSSLPDALSVRGRSGSRFVLDGLLVAGRSVKINSPDFASADNPKDVSENDSENDLEIDSESVYESDSEDVYISHDAYDAGELCEVTIRHCTLVPGWSLHCDCEPQRPNEPSLELEYTRARINIEHSIIGTILVEANERASEPQVIRISDSILDATSENRLAFGAYNEGLAYARLTIARTTVIGKIKTHAIALAENSIFKGVVTVGRRQQGCMRFCYVTPASRTPRRYECQPDLVEQKAAAKVRAAQELIPKIAPAGRMTEDGAEAFKNQLNELALSSGTTVNLRASERMRGSNLPVVDLIIDAAQTSERVRVEPQFNSLRYGAATYCQLAQACADEITQGADDESEMGVFHDLYQPQRASNLRARFDEYTPAGTEVGIIFAN
jgi:hypothetical protein